jgi:fluoroquinolone resistance protein
VRTLQECIGDSAYRGGEEFTALHVEKPGLDDVEFEACVFDRCYFESSTLRRVIFRDCEFRDCDLSLVRFVSCRFVECRLIRCRALGVAWSGAEGSLIARIPFFFSGCTLDMGSFQGVDIPGSIFRDCSVREVDFGASDLRKVDFAGSDLSGSMFHRCDLREARFAEAVGVVLDPRENRCLGAEFSAVEALNLLACFGIVVREGGVPPESTTTVAAPR